MQRAYFYELKNRWVQFHTYPIPQGVEIAIAGERWAGMTRNGARRALMQDSRGEQWTLDPWEYCSEFAWEDFIRYID